MEDWKKSCCSSLSTNWTPCSFVAIGHLGESMPPQSGVEEAWMRPLPKRVVENYMKVLVELEEGSRDQMGSREKW